MKGWSFLVIAVVCLGMALGVVTRCNSGKRMEKIIDDAYRPTPVPAVEPTPEPTEVPTYYTVTLYSGATAVKKWRVRTDADFHSFVGNGFYFTDDQGKSITISGTYTIEED